MMGDEELRISFLGAENKKRQIGVLADLNTCAPREIAERLDEMGLLAPEGLRASQFAARYRPAGKAALPPIDEARALELYREGLDDIAIGDALGVSPKRVQNWRLRKTDLRRPRGAAARKKKTTEGEEMPKEQQTVAAAPPPEPVAAPETLSVQMFLSALTEMLTPRAARGALWINGAPVNEIAGVRIRPCGDGLIVDVETEAARHG